MTIRRLKLASPYATDKLAHHPKVLAALRERRHQNPTVVHFMPALACNQRCSFCSYGHRVPEDGADQLGWKNMELMSDEFLPLDAMRRLVDDWDDMGVKAIELTGGGEPLIWPHVDEFFMESEGGPWDMAMVTNGTALTEARADLFAATRWKWARVSVDAGSAAQYSATRRVSEKHWDKAWAAVRRLVARKTDPEQRVGVGYVVDRHNVSGVYAGLAHARDAGADNVRVSMAFTPQGVNRIGQDAVDKVRGQLEMARANLAGPDFQINALFDERVGNLMAAEQDYEFCAVKEYLCVVGGDQNVYTCCTLAFNSAGLVGSFAGGSFKDLWWAPETVEWFSGHDAREVCRVPCLYEKRNKTALELLARPVPAHLNYL